MRVQVFFQLSHIMNNFDVLKMQCMYIVQLRKIAFLHSLEIHSRWNTLGCEESWQCDASRVESIGT